MAVPSIGGKECDVGVAEEFEVEAVSKSIDSGAISEGFGGVVVG